MRTLQRKKHLKLLREFPRQYLAAASAVRGFLAETDFSAEVSTLKGPDGEFVLADQKFVDILAFFCSSGSYLDYDMNEIKFDPLRVPTLVKYRPGPIQIGQRSQFVWEHSSLTIPKQLLPFTKLDSGGVHGPLFTAWLDKHFGPTWSLHYSGENGKFLHNTRSIGKCLMTGGKIPSSQFRPMIIHTGPSVWNTTFAQDYENFLKSKYISKETRELLSDGKHVVYSVCKTKETLVGQKDRDNAERK